jgi:hypothetical protein
MLLQSTWWATFCPASLLQTFASKTYTHISMLQAVSFLQDFKLGHYMKIPPRSMFIVQVCKPHTKLLTISFLLSSLYWINLSEKKKIIIIIIIIIIIFSLLNFLELVICFLHNFRCFLKKKLVKFWRNVFF